MGTKAVITVLGTPRSGTSAITRALPVMGAFLGDQLVPPGINNPTGFWEDLHTQQINIRLLELAGRHIEWPVLSREKIESSPCYSDVKHQAVELFTRRLCTNPLFAFKDPRANRLLFFWQEVFREIGCADHYVLALRNPLSVAASLKISAGIKRATALALWLECTVRAVQDTLYRRLVVVAYEQLIKNPGAEVLRMAAGLALEGHLRSDAFDSYTRDFINPEFMHIHHNADDLATGVQELPLVADVYRLLSRHASDALTAGDFWLLWLPLYTRFEREFPEFIAANKWLAQRASITVTPVKRMCIRLRAHGAGEMRRLAHRTLEKTLAVFQAP